MIMQQEEHSLSEDKPPSYIDLHTHSFMTGDGVLRVQNIFPDVSGGSRLPDYFSIGIHPKNIDPEFIERDLAIMDRVLAENRSGGAIAVGECGLDKFSLVDLETQEKVFVAQIQMALKYDLPMVIHSVRSWQEIIRIKDMKEEATNMERLSSDIHYIKKSLSSVDEKIDALSKQYSDLLTRVSALETKMKIYHNRED